MQQETVLTVEEIVNVSFEVTPQKPFNKCFQCPSFRNGCSGPNILIMPIERGCEFLQMTRVFLKYTYQHVADKTGISLATVKRLLTGKLIDPSYFTMQAIVKFLVGDPNGKSPCPFADVLSDPNSEQRLNDALRDLERALDDNRDYRDKLDNIQLSHNAELQMVRDEAQAKIDYLRAQLDRAQREIDYLLEDNKRKGRIVDLYISKYE